MTLLAIAFGLVGLGALVVAGRAVAQLGQTNKAMLILLADQVAADRKQQADNLAVILNGERSTRALLSSNHASTQEALVAALTGLHASAGAVLTEAVERTTTAIGVAMAAAVTPPTPPAPTPKDLAYQAAQGAVAADYRPEAIDDTDPSDAWIAPERGDADLFDPNDPNPTGIAGFTFDAPTGTPLPFDIPANFPVPNGNH